MKLLTPIQITAYLDRINLPKKYYPESKPTIDLAYITTLHVHHITSIPYENLSIHYSKEHNVSIEPDYLFDKIVRRGRGRGKFISGDPFTCPHHIGGWAKTCICCTQKRKKKGKKVKQTLPVKRNTNTLYLQY